MYTSVYEQYGKIKPRSKKGVEKPEVQKEKEKEKEKEEKKEKEKKQGFLELFNGDRVVVTLINGEKLSGTLRTDRYNKYDVLLDSILLPKHAILYIRKEDGER